MQNASKGTRITKGVVVLGASDKSMLKYSYIQHNLVSECTCRSCRRFVKWWSKQKT